MISPRHLAGLRSGRRRSDDLGVRIRGAQRVAHSARGRPVPKIRMRLRMRACAAGMRRIGAMHHDAATATMATRVSRSRLVSTAPG
jgi:hypothetical protein